MSKVLERISKLGIVPVIALDRAGDAKALAEALKDGGVPCAEITFRTEAAVESIRIMKENYPDMILGAGTVLTTEQADAAIEAGAMFVVSPGLNRRVVEHCIRKNITIIPGCSNPSDIEAAMELGLDTVKFFPAEAAGGVKMLKAMAAPYGRMKFMPTGGISQQNLLSYLENKNVIACGGSWMVKKEMIEAGDFEGIRKLTEDAVSEMLGFELRHVGINTSDEAEANKLTNSFSNLFGFEKKPGNSSKGNISIQTNFIERAIAYLENRGCEFNRETQILDNKGGMRAVYMKEEFGGFALQLIQK